MPELVSTERGSPARLHRWWELQEAPALRQYLVAIGAVVAVTLAASLFAPLIGAHAAALVFLLTVVLLGLCVGRGPTLFAAAMSAAFWDYFILPPVFAFRIDQPEDAMLLGMYFVVAIVLGQLTARIRAQEKARQQGEEQATALYVLTRELSTAANLGQMLQRVVQQIGRIFDAQIVVLLSDRPYRKGWSKDEVLTYLTEQSGKHFDPGVIAVFLKLLL